MRLQCLPELVVDSTQAAWIAWGDIGCHSNGLKPRRSLYLAPSALIEPTRWSVQYCDVRTNPEDTRSPPALTRSHPCRFTCHVQPARFIQRINFLFINLPTARSQRTADRAHSSSISMAPWSIPTSSMSSHGIALPRKLQDRLEAKCSNSNYPTLGN